jgi:hypothetical protein
MIKTSRRVCDILVTYRNKCDLGLGKGADLGGTLDLLVTVLVSSRF